MFDEKFIKTMLMSLFIGVVASVFQSLFGKKIEEYIQEHMNATEKA